jgi:hypothetical protein
MRSANLSLALLGMLWLGGCTFESPTVLADPKAVGDAIAGFPQQGSFKLESFDRAKRHYLNFASARVEMSPDTGIRYVMTFNDSTTMMITVQARKISDNNYLIRYFQGGAEGQPRLSDSGLAFLRVDSGVYYVLTGISSQERLDMIFAGDRPLQLSGSVVRLDNDHQAETISAYFRDHFDAFPEDQDYARLRLAK